MKYNKTVKRWLFARTRRQLPSIFLLSLFSAASSLAYLWLALLSKDLLEAAQGVLQSDRPETVWNALRQPSLYVPALTVVGVVLGQIVLHVLISRFKVYAAGKLEMSLRRQVFFDLLHADYAALHRYHSGELITRLTSDTTLVSQGVAGLIPSAVSLVARLIGGMALLIALAPGLSLVMIGVGVLVIVGSRFYGNRLKRLHKRCQEAYGKTRSFMQESFFQLLSVKAFGVEAPVTQELEACQTEHFRLKLRRNWLQILGSSGIYAVMTAAYYLMLLWCVVGLAVGTVTIGTLAALIQVFEQLQAPLKSASGLLSQYYSVIASAERLKQISEVPSEPEPLSPDETAALKAGFQKLVLSDVWFAYDDATPVLNGVDVTVRRGECVALVGESGIGKSTLMKLILSIYPCAKGTIRLEGDISLPVGSAGRCLMAYVPQGNVLISGTLRQNIAFFRTVSDERLAEVIRVACLDDFVATLPHGLDTVVGENGFGLSEGQAQRVGIARALIGDAPLLLLDECTSALDAQTEEHLLNNLRSLRDKAVLLISHKSTTVSGSDRVYRLSDGVVQTV